MSTKPKSKSDISKAEAMKALQDDKAKREQVFRKELEELMKKHNCALVPYMIVRGDGNRAGLDVIAQ